MQISKRLFKNIVTFVESILYLYNDGGKNEKKKRVARMNKNGQMSWCWKITFICSEQVLISNLVPIKELNNIWNWSRGLSMHCTFVLRLASQSYMYKLRQAETRARYDPNFVVDHVPCWLIFKFKFLTFIPVFLHLFLLSAEFSSCLFTQKRCLTFENKPNVRNPRIRHTFFKFFLEKISALVKQ